MASGCTQAAPAGASGAGQVGSGKRQASSRAKARRGSATTRAVPEGRGARQSSAPGPSGAGPGPQRAASAPSTGSSATPRKSSTGPWCAAPRTSAASALVKGGQGCIAPG
ncbi:MAG: hypothetical protein ACK559_06160 [bacterium]